MQDSRKLQEMATNGQESAGGATPGAGGGGEQNPAAQPPLAPEAQAPPPAPTAQPSAGGSAAAGSSTGTGDTITAALQDLLAQAWPPGTAPSAEALAAMSKGFNDVCNNWIKDQEERFAALQEKLLGQQREEAGRRKDKGKDKVPYGSESEESSGEFDKAKKIKIKLNAARVPDDDHYVTVQSAMKVVLACHHPCHILWESLSAAEVERLLRKMKKPFKHGNRISDAWMKKAAQSIVQQERYHVCARINRILKKSDWRGTNDTLPSFGKVKVSAEGLQALLPEEKSIVAYLRAQSAAEAAAAAKNEAAKQEQVGILTFWQDQLRHLKKPPASRIRALDRVRTRTHKSRLGQGGTNGFKNTFVSMQTPPQVPSHVMLCFLLSELNLGHFLDSCAIMKCKSQSAKPSVSHFSLHLLRTCFAPSVMDFLVSVNLACETTCKRLPFARCFAQPTPSVRTMCSRCAKGSLSHPISHSLLYTCL